MEPDLNPSTSGRKIDEAEILALIALLEDPDKEVKTLVSNKLIGFGEDIQPILDESFLNEKDPSQQARIHLIIEKLQANTLISDIVVWAETGGLDLFEGWYLVCKYRYPELKKEQLLILINKLKLDTWLELNNMLAPLDKVRILNNVIFDRHNFHNNINDQETPDNLFINKVLDTHRGNDLSLSLLYIIIAQRLSMPIFGVNTPLYLQLAYKENFTFRELKEYSEVPIIRFDGPGEILFYINAFQRGITYSKAGIDAFLNTFHYPVKPYYYQACSHIDLMLRLCGNLYSSYQKQEDEEHANGILKLSEILQAYSNIPL